MDIEKVKEIVPNLSTKELGEFIWKRQLKGEAYKIAINELYKRKKEDPPEWAKDE